MYILNLPLLVYFYFDRSEKNKKEVIGPVSVDARKYAIKKQRESAAVSMVDEESPVCKRVRLRENCPNCGISLRFMSIYSNVLKKMTVIALLSFPKVSYELYIATDTTVSDSESCVGESSMPLDYEECLLESDSEHNEDESLQLNDVS